MKDRVVSIALVTGKLSLFVQEDRGRYCCPHVRDGAPAVIPHGTLKHKGRRWSVQLCKICSAMHTLTPEQRAEESARSALLHITEDIPLEGD